MTWLWLLGGYVLVGAALGVAYYVWSRKSPEYASARSFEDFVAFVGCALWPIALSIMAFFYFSKLRDD